MLIGSSIQVVVERKIPPTDTLIVVKQFGSHWFPFKNDYAARLLPIADLQQEDQVAHFF